MFYGIQDQEHYNPPPCETKLREQPGMLKV